jgi:hypothetical protein
MNAHTTALLACRILAAYFVLNLIASGYFVGILHPLFADYTTITIVMTSLLILIVTIVAIAALWILAPKAAVFFLDGIEAPREGEASAVQPRDLTIIACMVLGIYFVFMGFSRMPNNLIVMFYFDSSVGNPQFWAQNAAQFTAHLAQLIIGAGLLVWARPIAKYTFPDEEQIN